MRELSPKKAIDELILERGPHHQKWLQKLAEKLRADFDEAALFNSENQRELDRWVKDNEESVLENLDRGFGESKKLKSVDAPGHDLSHLLDNLDSALRIFEEYGDFSEAEKLEVILACLGHDLGRYVEKELDQISLKDTLFLIPALVGRRISGIKDLPEILQKRILYDIAAGSIPKTGHRTTDVVAQCDREQLSGGVFFARNVAFFANLRSLELIVPLAEEQKIALPLPDDYNDRYFLTQVEFFMRNVYPAVSPKGAQIRNSNIQKSAVIMMLATEGKENEFKQVFAPELGVVDKNDLNWSKKALPTEIFEAAKKEKEEFLEKLDLNAHIHGQELSSIKHLLVQDKISVSPDFDDVIKEGLNRCTDQERKNLWILSMYSLSERHERRVRDLKLLRKYKEGGGVVSLVAAWLIEEFNSREQIYKAAQAE